MNRTKEDDGSLAFLNIQPDPSNKHFITELLIANHAIVMNTG